MKQWTKRKPSANLVFHTKAIRNLAIGGITEARTIYDERNIISITTENAVDTPVGTFSINLVYVKNAEGEPIYKKLIKPLDLVEIYLNSADSYGIDEATMIGIVDSVTEVTSINDQQPSRSIQIKGRALGAVWLFDLVKYFINALGMPDELKQRNLALRLGSIKLEFFDQTAIHVIKTIVDLLPALEIELKDAVLKDFIDVGSELFVREGETVFNLGISAYSGSIFDYFRKYIGEPFNELWTDSKNGKLYLRMRPTPFSSVDDSEPSIDSSGNPTNNTDWNSIRNWIDGNPYHRIDPADIISKSLQTSQAKAYSIFSVLPGETLVGGGTEYATFPPLIDPDLYREVGSRDIERRIQHIPLTRSKSMVSGAGGTLERFRYYRNKLYLWNKDNHRFEEGSITIKGNSNIRAGDKLMRTSNEFMYYILGVRNEYRYGNPFITTIRVERGMTDAYRKILYTHGLNYLNSITETEDVIVKANTEPAPASAPIEVPSQTVSDITRVLSALEMDSDSAINLVTGTGAAESLYLYKEQIGGGEAKSYWQIEVSTAIDICINYIKHREELLYNVAAVTEVTAEWIKNPSESVMGIVLLNNDKFAIAMCRLKYRRVPSELPDAQDVRAMATYWKNHYNTRKGKGAVAQYVDTWNRITL